MFSRSFAKRLYSFLSGYNFCLILLTLQIIITFLGTLYQIDHSLEESIQTYFSSWGTLLPITTKYIPLALPLPGTLLITLGLLINLFLGAFKYVHKGKKHWGIALTHLGLIYLIATSAITGLFSLRGHITIHEGGAQSAFILNSTQPTDILKTPQTHKLPFTLTLKKFNAHYYPHSQTASSYESQLTCQSENSSPQNVTISMNNPFRKQGYTFYQQSYQTYKTSTGQTKVATVLGVVYDPCESSPKLATILIILGMLLHFFPKLIAFLRRKDPQSHITPPTKKQRILFVGLTVAFLVLFSTGLLSSILSNKPEFTLSHYTPWETSLIKIQEQLPLIDHGRIKPLASYARLNLLQMRGKSTLKISLPHETKKLSATEIWMDIIWRPEIAQNYPLFLIENANLIEKLHLPTPTTKRPCYTYNELAQSKLFPSHSTKTEQRQRLLEFNKHLSSFSDEEQKIIQNLLLFHYPIKSWEQIKKNIQQLTPESKRRLSWEVFYNKLDGLYLALGCLLASAIFTLLSKSFSQTIYRKGAQFLGVLTAISGVLFLLLVIVLRSLIMQRAPIGNLYDTIPFTALSLLILSLIIELKSKQGLALIAGTLLAALGCQLANIYDATSGTDSMSPLVAVLKSNFWLSSHVITIILGYASGLLAAILSHFYLIGDLLLPQGLTTHTKKILTRFVYGDLCFSLLFSALGTLLGGIWANESWGRFWGWDPKENGALMICLWLTLLLHRKLSGKIQEKGLHLGAFIAGNIIAFSWWGVNMLGIGLHAYGFTAGSTALTVFYGIEALLLLIILCTSYLKKNP